MKFKDYNIIKKGVKIKCLPYMYTGVVYKGKKGYLGSRTLGFLTQFKKKKFCLMTTSALCSSITEPIIRQGTGFTIPSIAH